MGRCPQDGAPADGNSHCATLRPELIWSHWKPVMRGRAVLVKKLTRPRINNQRLPASGGSVPGIRAMFYRRVACGGRETRGFIQHRQAWQYFLPLAKSVASSSVDGLEANFFPLAVLARNHYRLGPSRARLGKPFCLGTVLLEVGRLVNARKYHFLGEPLC